MAFKCTECDYCECLGCAYVAKNNSCKNCRNRNKLKRDGINITRENILNAIKNLKKGTSPGPDCISPEHLVFAASSRLADLLANIYSIIINTTTIPEIFKKKCN